MIINKYIDSVCNEIDSKKVHSRISRELEDHLIEYKEVFLQQGFDSVEAEKKSVKEMGDPSIVGKRLNSIHKRKPEWNLLIITIFIFIIGAAVQILEFPQIAHLKVINSTIISIVIFLLFYFTDYTFLIRYKTEMLVGIILIVIMPFIFKTFDINILFFLIILPPLITLFKGDKVTAKSNESPINEKSNVWIDQLFIILGYPSESSLRGIFTIVLLTIILSTPKIFANINNTYFYILVFLIMLINLQFKTKKKALPFILYYSFILSYTLYFKSYGELLPMFFISSLSLTYMLYKNWIPVNKTLGNILIWLPFILNLSLSIRNYHINGVILGEWINNLYIVNINKVEISKIIQSAKFLGKGSYNFKFNIEGIEHFMLTYMIGNYGWLAGIVMISALLLLVIYLIRVTSKSKQEFGRMLSFVCTTVISAQIITYILSNFGFFSFTAGYLPLFITSNLGTLLNAACLGLIFSVRSNRNIVDEIGVILKMDIAR